MRKQHYTAVVRLSDKQESKTIEKQLKEIAWWTDTKGLTLGGNVVLNGNPRFGKSSIEEKEEWLIDQIKQLDNEWCVFLELDRLGGGDFGWIPSFVRRLDKLGMRVAVAEEDLELDLSKKEVWMQVLDSTAASIAWVNKHGRHIARGRRETIEKGNCASGNTRYGYDFNYYNKDDEFLFRVIEDVVVHRDVDGKITTHVSPQGRVINNRVLLRTKVLPNGDIQHYNDKWVFVDGVWKCERNPVEWHDGNWKKKRTPNLVESEIVKEIFHLADIGLTKVGIKTADIAKTLNHKFKTNISYKPCFKQSGSDWTATTVMGILTDPIYKGYPREGVRLNRKTQVVIPAFKDNYIPLKEEDREALRIVPIEQWDRVNSVLSKVKQKTKIDANGDEKKFTPRQLRNDFFYARDWIQCSDCGCAIYSCKKRNTYCCRRCGHAQAKVVHALIDNWAENLLQEYQNVSQHGEGFDNTFCDLWKTKTDGTWQMGTIQGKMLLAIDEYQLTIGCDCTKYDACIATAEEINRHKINPHPDATKRATVRMVQVKGQESDFTTIECDRTQTDFVESAYLSILESTQLSTKTKIAELEQEIKTLFEASWKNEDLRKCVEEKANTLTSQKKTLEAQLDFSLLKEYRKSKDRIEELVNIAKQLKDATNENKKRLLEPYIDHITLFFNKSLCRGGRYKLIKMEIHSKGGLPVKTYSEEEIAPLYKEISQSGKYRQTPYWKAKQSERVKQLPKKDGRWTAADKG